MLELVRQAEEAFEPLPNQQLALDDVWSKIIVYRGGYRSGKTVAEVCKAVDLGLLNSPHPILFVAPTFHQVRQVFVKEALRLCAVWGWHAHWHVSNKTLYIYHPDTTIEIVCRSADNPRSIEGLTVAAVIIDEWELCDVEAIIVAMARRSIVCPVPQIFLGGTPEGFGAGYELIERNPQAGTRVIVSRTADNPHISKDYVAGVLATSSKEWALEKTEGERSAPAGRVYTHFNRLKHCRVPCVDVRNPSARLEVWADFNRPKMVWLFVLVDDAKRAFHVVGELVIDNTESQTMAAAAAEWISRWRGRNNRGSGHEGTPVVCDASGKDPNSVTPLSHVKNLIEAGFKPFTVKKNPRIEDRVASVQKVLFGDDDIPRLTYDMKEAPFAVRCIETQPNDKQGNPSKKDDLDHANDAIGYGVMWHSPAFRPAPLYIQQRRAALWDKMRELARRQAA